MIDPKTCFHLHLNRVNLHATLKDRENFVAVCPDCDKLFKVMPEVITVDQGEKKQ